MRLVSTCGWRGLVTGAWLLVLAANLARGEDDAQSLADAMAFVRVSGDLTVRFKAVYREPYVERNVEFATGSGFVIAPSGLVLTNLHVVSQQPLPGTIDGNEAELGLESARIEAAIGPGGTLGVYEAAVVASDPDLDLAVLQVTAGDLPYLPFGDSDAVETGGQVQVLGFPFGRKVEVGRSADRGVVPRVSVTRGSLSAAREDDEGGRRYLQTDASIQPGNSGGPMVDDEGYVIGVVRLKLSRGATAQGAGFGIPVNLVKDFLDAHGMLALLPVSRLRPGVVHSFDWKGVRVEMPDGLQDGSPARLRVATGEIGDAISFRLDRVATSWDRETLEAAVLAGTALPGFVPAPATPARQVERGRPSRRLGVATGTLPDGGGAFRVEYAVLGLKGESVVARYVGPPDALAFNLGLVRRSLETLEAVPLLVGAVGRPLAPALEVVALPGVEDGGVAMPSGWSLEPAFASVCQRVPPADSGLLASPQGDFTVVLRALRWPGRSAALGEALGHCGAPLASSAGAASYGSEFNHLGVPTQARAVLLEGEGDTLLLEMQAPAAKAPFVEQLYERWVREVAGARPAVPRNPPRS
jgi:S1-C subfamily serine protease